MRRFLVGAFMVMGGCSTQPLDAGQAEPAAVPSLYVVVAECADACPWLAPERTSDAYVTRDAELARARLIADGDAFAAAEPIIADNVRGVVGKVAAHWTATPDGDTDVEFNAPDGQRLHLLIYTTTATR